MLRGIGKIIVAALLLSNSLPWLLAQQAPLHVQLEGTLTIKNEPTQVGSLIHDVGPISSASRSELAQSEILSRLAHAEPFPQGAQFRVEEGLQFRYEGTPYTILLVPAARSNCLINYFAVYAFEESGKHLGFLLFEQAPGEFSIRDEQNSGIDLEYERTSIQKVTVASPSTSVWQCIGKSLKKRVEAQTLAKFGIEALLCAASKVTCIGLAVDISALAVGVGSDCIGKRD